MSGTDLRRLKRNWGAFSVLAVVVGVALSWVDQRLKAASGFGIIDLEFCRTGSDAATIIGAWKETGVAGEAGFLMGLDYLYMPAYGLALYFGGLAAREAFARGPGALRAILGAVAGAPPVAAVLDVVENAGEVRMLLFGFEPDIAPVLWWFTVAKFALVAVGALGALAGLGGLLAGRLKAS